MGQKTQTEKKVINIFKLMELLLDGREIANNDEIILNEFECDKKTLGRYFEEIDRLYSHIIKIKKVRTNYYKMIKVSDIFKEFIEKSDNAYEIYELFEMVEGLDIAVLKDLEQKAQDEIKNHSNRGRDVFLFRNSIMEDLVNQKQKDIFQEIKSAVKNMNYINLETYPSERYQYKFYKSKPIKIIFVDDNWYLGVKSLAIIIK